jgi:hypothetical protein
LSTIYYQKPSKLPSGSPNKISNLVKISFAILTLLLCASLTGNWYLWKEQKELTKDFREVLILQDSTLASKLEVDKEMIRMRKKLNRKQQQLNRLK